MWDPWARLEYEQRRMMEDPFFKYEKEQERMLWDPYYRMEKQMADPMYRFEREQEKMMVDPWFRQLYRMEHGLLPGEVPDPVYVQEKESGLGTRPSDYLNPEYRVYMDQMRRGEEQRAEESAEFMRKFFDPEWINMEDINRQLKEMGEKRRDEPVAMVEKKGGFMSFLKKLFGFL